MNPCGHISFRYVTCLLLRYMQCTESSVDMKYETEQMLNSAFDGARLVDIIVIPV